MKNEIPKPLPRLLALGENMCDGLHTHGSTIGIMQNTEPVFRIDLQASLTGDNDYQIAKAAKINATAGQTAATEKVRAFAVKARDVFKPVLGNTWSQAWSQAGFVNQSLSIPATVPELMSLAQRLQLYLQANPARANAPLQVSNTVAANLFDGLSTASSGVNQAATTMRSKRGTRDLAVETLRKRMRGLINELAQLLGENDPRWQAFGLNIPGAAQTPEIPGFNLAPGASGHLVVDLHETPRAELFHVWTQRLGTDAEPILAGTFRDRHIDLNTFAAGTAVRVAVSAVNSGGESARSTPIEKTVV